MSTLHQLRPVKWTFALNGQPLYHEAATHIEIVDEGAGEFLLVSQQSITGVASIRLDPNEVGAFCTFLEQIADQCESGKE